MASVAGLKNQVERLSEHDKAFPVTFNNHRWPGLTIHFIDDTGKPKLVVNDPPSPPTVKANESGKEIPMRQWDRMTATEKREWISTGEIPTRKSKKTGK